MAEQEYTPTDESRETTYREIDGKWVSIPSTVDVRTDYMFHQEHKVSNVKYRDNARNSAFHKFNMWLHQEREKVRAEERAKRPDREQIAEAIQGDGSAYLRLHHPEAWAVVLAQADRVLSSLALEPETREEPTGRAWVPAEELDFYVEPLPEARDA